MVRRALRYVRRGAVVTVADLDPNRTLLDLLRLDRRETGTKEGCNEGDCGACTVVLARLRAGKLVYEPVNACILLAGQADGAEIITVEDLAADGALHPVQQALVRHHGSQCGFCTPGIVMSLFALYHRQGGAATRAEVQDQLAGNLCRCTGYRPIVDAALEVCAGPAADGFVAGEEARRQRLESLADSSDVFIGGPERFFAAPGSMASLAGLLELYPDARLIGGATDVGLWITKKLQDIPRVIWLGRLGDLDFIEEAPAELRLGGGVTLEGAAPHLAGVAADLGEVMRRFGSQQVRTSGTVGGNLANGSPIGDLAPCLIALDARIVLQRGEVRRQIPLEAFFIAYGRQDRAAGEIVRHVAVPRLGAGQHFRAYKVSKRFDEDISAVLGAFLITLEGRQVASARIAYGGMAGTPKRAGRAEAALAGASLDSVATWEAAIEALGADYQPLDDARASAAYRLATARALLQKALFELAGAPVSVTRVHAPRGQAQ